MPRRKRAAANAANTPPMAGFMSYPVWSATYSAAVAHADKEHFNFFHNINHL
jgi:hypothetical protein